MANQVGTLIKEARTAAGMTQEQLARKIAGVAAADISKYERGEVIPTQAVLKEIAKLTGVTQSSLLNAAKESTAAAAKKTTTVKTTTKSTATKATTAKATTAKSTAAKTTTAKSSAAETSMKVSAAEKKLVEMYRAADANTRKAATRVLKGECADQIPSLLNSTGNGMSDMVSELISGTLGNLLGIGNK